MKEVKKKMAGLLFAVSDPHSTRESAMFKVEQILDIPIGKEIEEKRDDSCHGEGTISRPATIRDAIEEYLKWK